MACDLIIYNGIVLMVNDHFEIIKNGIICIQGDRIESAGHWDKNCPIPPAREYIDAEGGIVMPGLVNIHTHLPMTLFRGLADDLPLDVWLNKHIFPAEAAHINQDSVYASALLACAEMILSGTTTCCDGYFLENFVAEAVHRAGIRAVLGQGVIDFPAPGVPNPSDNLAYAENFVQKWKGKSELIQPSIFCHSPYTCSGETLKAAQSLAESLGVLFQIHVAETRWEADQMRSKYGFSPVGYLDHLGILDRHTLMVHGVWMDDRDIDIIAARGSGMAHNPESNMKLASGVAPIPACLKAGIPVGLGTDGCASNNNLDMFDEMDAAAKLHKTFACDPTIMNARTVVRMATLDGARAIGLDHLIGSIEPGKQADMIVLSADRPNRIPLFHPESYVVYAAGASDVRDAVIAGRIVMKNRKLTCLNLHEIYAGIAPLQTAIKQGLK
jgi:5-methylthioadenosine/S-adenosylhomocysteine deaminase